MPPGGGPLGFCIVGGSMSVCDCKAEDARGDERMKGKRSCPLAVKIKVSGCECENECEHCTVISQTGDASRTTSWPDGRLCLGAFFRTASCSLHLAGAGPSGCISSRVPMYLPRPPLVSRRFEDALASSQWFGLQRSAAVSRLARRSFLTKALWEHALKYSFSKRCPYLHLSQPVRCGLGFCIAVQ